MAHKLLRYREHHKALEARFSPPSNASPGGPDDSQPAATPAPSDTGIFGTIVPPPDPTTKPGRPDPPSNHPTPKVPIPPILSTIIPTRTTPTNTRPVPLPNPTLSSSDSSASSSVSTLSSSTRSTSSSVVQTTPSIPLAASPTHQVQTETTVVGPAPASVTFTPSSSIPSVTPSSTGTSSSLGTGPIVGLAAAGVAGLAVLGVAGIWLFKKYVSHKNDPIEEPSFTRHSWMRNSLVLPDEPTDGAGMGGVAGAAGIGAAAASQGPNNRPRPPTMIERHQANFAAMRSPSPGQQQGQNYNGNMAGYGYGGYDSSYATTGIPAMPPIPVMRSVSPGRTFAGYDTNPQPYYNPIASPPPIGPSPEPGNGPGFTAAGAPASYFTRHNGPSSPPISVPSPYPHGGESNGGYATMERGASFTPFQAQTYNEISQQLDRSPFADPAPPSGTAETRTGNPTVSTAHMMSKKGGERRPETVYDEEDAYGGI